MLEIELLHHFFLMQTIYRKNQDLNNVQRTLLPFEILGQPAIIQSDNVKLRASGRVLDQGLR